MDPSFNNQAAIKTNLDNLKTKQDTTNTKLDTLETTLTAIETDAAALEVLVTATNSTLDTIKVDTEAIETAVEILDNCVSGNEMQVDIVASLPAGNNNIGNVDIASINPGSNTNNLGKASDASYTSGHVGVMSLAVRNDALDSLVGADGDYAPLQVNAVGGLYTIESYETSINKAVVTASDASTNELVAAQGSGVKIAIVDIIISSSAAQNVIIKDASAAILGPIYLAANATTSINLNRPMILTANQALNYTNSSADAHSVSVTYFTTS